MGVAVTKILDDKGTQITGSVSRTFDIGKVKDIEFKLTPSFKATYLDNYFGLSGHSNDIFGLSLGIMRGNAIINVLFKQAIGFNDNHSKNKDESK